MSPLLQRFADFYSHFDEQNLDKLTDFYAANIVFKDPVHEISGQGALRAYFDSVSANIISCKFEFTNWVEANDQAFLCWKMHYAHKRLSNGKAITIEGTTLVRFKDGKVCYHCDYYDMGAMIYENVPVLGRVVRWLRTRMSPPSMPLEPAFGREANPV